MNKYFYNGRKISKHEAQTFFMHASPGKWELNQTQMFDKWDECQVSENERDLYLPAELEIVQCD